MAYNKHKGVLVFMILYTVLFVFDGIRVFDAPLPSSLTTYLVYTIMFLYGCFLFKSELLKKWEEVRSSKRKFFLGGFKRLALTCPGDHFLWTTIGNIEAGFGTK